MKQLLFTILFLVTATTFAQSNGVITGNLLDTESNNEPLMFANVTIKETGEKITTDETGAFKFENLKEGDYTLVCSFVGYETKEIEAKATLNNTTQVELGLGASTLSLDDLVLAIASADKKETATIN